MPSKFIILLLAILISLSAPSQAAQQVSWDLINNQYRINLQQGDKGTMYFMNDQSIVFIPANNNTTYTHMCWAHWKLRDKEQTLSIRGANFCNFLKGQYSISKEGKNFKLVDGAKKIYLQTVKSR